jgi:hypothetical protein
MESCVMGNSPPRPELTVSLFPPRITIKGDAVEGYRRPITFFIYALPVVFLITVLIVALAGSGPVLSGLRLLSLKFGL